MRVSCSWCHEMNDVGELPTWCSSCGHRADLPRMECNCPVCLRPQGPRGDPRNFGTVTKVMKMLRGETEPRH